VLLLLLALFPVLASLLDLANVAANGIPSDHRAAFAAVSGLDWSPARAAAAGISRYVSLLETGYALHELVFGLLFLLIVAIPFRRGETWAWLGCWLVLIADLGYTFTFGRHDQAILRNSLIADVALPILLLVQAPRFFGRPARRSPGSPDGRARQSGRGEGWWRARAPGPRVRLAPPHRSLDLRAARFSHASTLPQSK
jgi:hypothetical protein